MDCDFSPVFWTSWEEIQASVNKWLEWLVTRIYQIQPPTSAGLNGIHKSYLIVKGIAVLLDMLLNILIVTDGYPHLQRRLRQFVLKKQALATMGWTILPHLTCSTNLAPSGFHLFGPLKRYSKKCHFADDRLKHGVHEELWYFSKEFYVTSIQHLTKGGKKVCR